MFAESYQEAGEVFFDKWFTPDDCSTETSYHRQIRGQLEYVFDNNQDKLSPISTDSLQDAINSLKPLKAPGLDGIVNIVIKKNSHVLAPTLLKIYNACLNIMYFPRDWKKAKIIVIPKRGRINDGLPSSYRPISLIPVFGKIFERILSYILNDLSINKDWISNNQFGFVNGKSTVDALDKLVTTVEENNKLKKFTLCLLFDIKGAFDNAWHPGILKKLLDLGCPTPLVMLIKSYLSDRSVSYGDKADNITRTLQKSCPQGSILSPFLWSINVDDLLRSDLPTGSTIQAYADDICITISSKDANFLNPTAKKDIYAIRRMG